MDPSFPAEPRHSRRMDPVIPAKAGICSNSLWIPACAGMTILKRIERAPRAFGAPLARPAHIPPPSQEGGREGGAARTRARRTLDTPFARGRRMGASPSADGLPRLVIPPSSRHSRESGNPSSRTRPRAPPRRAGRGVRKNTRAPDTGHAFARGRRMGASPPADGLPRLVIPPSSRHSLIGSSFPRKRESIMANTRPRAAPPPPPRRISNRDPRSLSRRGPL